MRKAPSGSEDVRRLENSKRKNYHKVIYDQDHYVPDQEFSDSFLEFANLDKQSEVNFEKLQFHGDMIMSRSFNF